MVVKTLECSAQQLDINSTKTFAPLSLSQQVLTNLVKKGGDEGVCPRGVDLQLTPRSCLGGKTGQTSHKLEPYYLQE